MTSHRMTGTVEYNAWKGIRRRCNNPKDAAYSNYGGRGIGICDRWDSFSSFFEDMGLKPKGTSIDRIDNDKGYYPDNCRWATRSEQSRNRRMYKNNSTGIQGVSYIKARKQYRVDIFDDGKIIYLGKYKTLEEATVVRREAEIAHGYN